MTSVLPRRLRAVVDDQLSCPARRGGYALVASTVITSGLGLAYWWLAARLYTEAEVGRGAALISTMLLITEVSILGMASGLVRFVPRAGRRTSQLIGGSYLTGALLAAIVAVASLTLLDGLVPALDVVSEPAMTLWFVASAMVWVVFVLQDGALTGLGKASLIPPENFFFGAAKIALLLIFAQTLGGDSLLLSWTMPAFLAVAAVTVLIFGYLAPNAEVAEAKPDATFPALLRFSAGDHLATLMVRAAALILPIIVVATRGAEANSRYYVAFSTAYVLYLASSNIGSSLVAESSRAPHRLHTYAARTLRQCMLLIVPGSIIMALAAGLYLEQYGSGYPQAASLLRLFALAAIPNSVTTIYISVLRSQRRLRRIAVVQGALGLPTLLLAPTFLDNWGLTGFGVLWFTVQAAVALGVLVAGFWDLWAPLIHPRMLDRMSRAAGEPTVLGSSDQASILSDKPDRAVVRLAEDPIIVKVARSEDAASRLDEESRWLQALRAHPALGSLRDLLPEILDAGRHSGQRYVAETAMAGTSAADRFGSALPDVVATDLARALTTLHGGTAQERTSDDELVARWIDDRIEVVGSVLTPDQLVRLQRLFDDVREDLHRGPVTTSWVHGDLSPANILTDDEGRIVGIIDWEYSDVAELPDLDHMQFLLSLRVQSRVQELGSAVVDILDNGLTESESTCLDRDGTQQNPHLSTRSVVLLTWLRHVASNLSKGASYAGNRLWVVRNILPVLATIDVEIAPARQASSLDRLRARVTTAVSNLRAARTTLVLGSLAMAGAATWLLALDAIDEADMGELGLVGAVPWWFHAALAGTMVGTVATLAARPATRWLLWSHLVVIAGMLHATPALIYGSPRYSWSWKHAGVVDYVQRNGSLDPDIAFLDIYHSWPGLFGVTATVSDLTGIDPLTMASWAPFVFTIGSLVALRVLFAAFTDDIRVIGSAQLLFLVSNWVGQEYFSPQAFGFFLYLTVLAVALPIERVREAPKVELLAGIGPQADSPLRRSVAMGLIVLLVLTIAGSHQLTPFMLVASFGAAALLRRARTSWIAITSAALILFWFAGPAWSFFRRNLLSTLDTIGTPTESASGSLLDTSALSSEQLVVVWAGRGLVLAMGGLAVLGFLTRWRRGRAPVLAGALLVTPGALLLTDYEGEVLFRAYLFATPWLALLGAYALHDLLASRRRVLGAMAAVCVVAVLGTGFVLAYHGKEQLHHFRPDEVAAAEWIYDNAPPGTLLIEGSRNYPGQFRNYENLFYVPIARESASTQTRIQADPVAVLAEWLDNDRYAASYLIITRSMITESATLGTTPPELLEDIDAALRSSPRFRVARLSPNAVVYQLRRDE